MRQRSRCGASLLGALVIGVLGAATAVAQDAPAQKRLEVEAFDQLGVASSVDDLFGKGYDLGTGIAKLVRQQLAAMGADTAAGSPLGTVSGTIITFGRAEGQGDVAGVSIARVRVGLGRRQEKALVALEARLTDVASGEILTMATGQGESSKGGMNLFARTRGGTDLASLDLSGEEFRKTSLGDATHQAIEALCKEIMAAADRLGTIAVAAQPEPTPEPAPVSPPSVQPAVSGGGVVGSFAWAPYMFRGTEHFKYDVRRTEDGTPTAGFYQLDFQPAGENRVRMKAQGQVGDESFSNTVTMGVGAQGMQMGMGQMMALGPIGILLFNPTAWIMFDGRELTVGDEWNYSSGGDQLSIKVQQQCSHAGQNGLLVVMQSNGETHQETCLAPEVALPLRMLMQDGNDRTEMTLVEYRP